MTGKALKDSIKIVHSFPDMRLILSSRLLGLIYFSYARILKQRYGILRMGIKI
ncbi:unnamed protein product [Brassica rapa subsp. trilocularis]